MHSLRGLLVLRKISKIIQPPDVRFQGQTATNLISAGALSRTPRGGGALSALPGP